MLLNLIQYIHINVTEYIVSQDIVLEIHWHSRSMC